MRPCSLSDPCPNCGKTFNNKNAKTSLLKHLSWCNKKYEFLMKYNLTAIDLQQKYGELGSVLEFQKAFPHWENFAGYYRLFKELGVSVSLKVASNHEGTKSRRKITNIEKTGYEHNFNKNHPSRKKWEQKLFDEEGITNVFQREAVKEKALKTVLERYGKELWLHAITMRGKGVISKLNKEIFQILQDLGILFEIEFKLEKPKGYYAYDVLFDGNKIIEINGDYWHGNPKIYKASDILLKGSSQEFLVSEKWARDEVKLKWAESNGFQVLVIWENDLKFSRDSIIEEIKNYAKM